MENKKECRIERMRRGGGIFCRRHATALVETHPPSLPPSPLQVIDVLVDTGSAGMGVPIQMPANWTASEEAPFVSLDLQKAGAETVLCKDPRCR